MLHLKRLLRMAPMFLKGEITWGNFINSTRLAQKSVCLVGGGMVFCDRADEALFFQDNDDMQPTADQ